jgi:ribokinase
MAISRKILVLGSVNIDLVQKVPRLPQLGETIRGEELRSFVGGKGANQACAASLLGGQAFLAGRVGNDVFGPRLRQELEASGVDMSLLAVSDTASGTATILVLPSGDNMIVISPGANATVSADIAVEAVRTLAEGDFLLCQLEIPMVSVAAALKEARSRGAVTILDPAPAHDLSGEVLRYVSILTPNQTEASFLVDDTKRIDTNVEAERAAERLRQRGAEAVIVKMGEQGALITNNRAAFLSRGFRVKAIDTTAAGDAFNAGLAVALAEGKSLQEAARFANAAGALAVTRTGAIQSLPRRAEVEQLLADNET